jgi:hypothetical protein
MASSAKKARKRDNPPATGPPVMDSSPERRSRVLTSLRMSQTVRNLLCVPCQKKQLYEKVDSIMLFRRMHTVCALHCRQV